MCAAVAARARALLPRASRLAASASCAATSASTDRRLRAHSCASAHGTRNGLHRPDLVLWPSAQHGELPVAVEVELTIKAIRRLVEICRAWARCRAVAGVLYFASADVERALVRAVEKTYASERIVILPLDSLPGVEAALAGAWSVRNAAPGDGPRNCRFSGAGEIRCSSNQRRQMRAERRRLRSPAQRTVPSAA